MGSNISGNTSGSSPRPPNHLNYDVPAGSPVGVNPDSSFSETLRLALDRIKVLETTNKDLEERIKTQERMILELVERNHFLSKSNQDCICGKGDRVLESQTPGRPASIATGSTRRETPTPGFVESVKKPTFTPSAATIQEYSGHEYSVPSTCFQEYDVVSELAADIPKTATSSSRKEESDSGFNETRSSGEDANNEEVKRQRQLEGSVIESSGEISIDEKCTRFTPPHFASVNQEFDVNKPPELPPKGIPPPSNVHSSNSTDEK